MIVHFRIYLKKIKETYSVLFVSLIENENCLIIIYCICLHCIDINIVKARIKFYEENYKMKKLL